MMFNAGNFPCLLGAFGTSAPWLGEVDEALFLETEVEAKTRPRIWSGEAVKPWSSEGYDPNEKTLLVGGDWNIWIVFPYLGNVIIPTD